MTEPEKTIMRAAANIAREDALARAKVASSDADLALIRDALAAYHAIEHYMATREDDELPF